PRRSRSRWENPSAARTWEIRAGGTAEENRKSTYARRVVGSKSCRTGVEAAAPGTAAASRATTPSVVGSLRSIEHLLGQPTGRRPVFPLGALPNACSASQVDVFRWRICQAVVGADWWALVGSNHRPLA